MAIDLHNRMGAYRNHKAGRGSKDKDNKDKADRNNRGHKGNRGTDRDKEMEMDMDNIDGYPYDSPCLASLPPAWNVASLFFVI